MDWLSGSNPFEDNRERYSYGSPGYGHGDTRYGYEYSNSGGYGESHAAPQYGSHSMPVAEPRASAEYEYRYEEAPPAYRNAHSEESSPRAADSPPPYDRFREYEPALAPAYDRYNDYAEQPSFGSRYEVEPSYGSRYNDYGDVGYGGDSESRLRTYNYNKSVATSGMEPSFTADAEVTEATEEVLVSLRGAQVHLVDDQESPLLGEGEFAVVLIEEAGNGIVTFVRVGDNLRWPLTKDEPAVKLDSTHYFFTIRVPRPVDEMDMETARCPSQEVMSYGVTFPALGQEEHLRELDVVLNQYSEFSNPQLVRAEPEVDEYDGGFRLSRLSYTPMDAPREFVTINKLEVMKQKEGSEFWEVMAPNVNDYNSDVAKTLAAGTGHLIRGLFWLRDTTVSNLENGSAYVKDKVDPNPRKPSTISPTTINNLRRVRNLSMATEQVASSLLNGVIKVAGFFTGALMRSEAGRRIFQLVPGEVAMVSMDSFGMFQLLNIFDCAPTT
ncbi:hypothetical protein M758_4G209500 [Ceratodon purpureus]|nr:hypothetical protein M758_4G209500 [Ceratodon purpureus]